MVGGRVTKAAFERFLEILSEASRHVPETPKAKAPDLPGRRIGDIGNHLRHAYHRVDAGIPWDLYDSAELSNVWKIVGELRSKLADDMKP